MSGYVRLAKALRGSVKCLAPRSFTWPNLQPLMTKPRRSCPTALAESYVCWPNSTRRPGAADDGPRWVGFSYQEAWGLGAGNTAR